MKQYSIDATQHQSGQFPGNAAKDAADKAIKYAKEKMGMANMQADISDLEDALRP
jgi:hypothetical protein